MNRIPDAVIAQARNRAIAEVAIMLGGDARTLSGNKAKNTGMPCPGCGGDDRFSVDPDENVFYCRFSGEGGDPIRLVRHVHKVSFAEAVEMLTGERAIPERQPPDPEKQNRYRRDAQVRAYKIWNRGYSIDSLRGGRLVGRYWAIRAIPMPSWHMRTVREIDRLPYWHWSKARQEFIVIHEGPAKLAAITGPDGKFIGVHRTWLDFSKPSGKAEIFDPETGEQLEAKKVEGSQRGGKIVLREGSEWPDLILGEGIETTLSHDAIKRCGSAELWCGLNKDNIAGKALTRLRHPTLKATDKLGRMRSVKVGGPEPDPADLDCLQVPAGRFARTVILGDGDSDRFETEAAMQRACRRLASPDMPAVIDWAPDGQDWNDVLRRSIASRGAAATASPAAPDGRATMPGAQSRLQPSADRGVAA